MKCHAVKYKLYKHWLARSLQNLGRVFMNDLNDTGYWRRHTSSSGIFKIIDEEIAKMLEQNPTSMPDLRKAQTLLITSDYSGSHAGSKYQVLSFLITSLEEFQKWEPKRRKIKAQHIPDNRRMSFKGLNDVQKQKTLKPFLNSAEIMSGLVFTVAIEANIKTLFEGKSPVNLDNPDFSIFKSWKPKVLENAFRTVHFLSFLLSRIAVPLQHVLWFSDEDEIAANPERITQLTNLVAWIGNSYLDFALGHLRCGTTNSDDGSRQIEDLAAIPDMIAGAISEQLNLESVILPENPKIFWVHRGDYSGKTSFITWWLTDTDKPLKRIFCSIDTIENSSSTKVSLFHFYNRN